jgi:hypothetical protein
LPIRVGIRLIWILSHENIPPDNAAIIGRQKVYSAWATGMQFWF